MPTPPEAITGTGHRIGDGAGQLQVEALAGAVAVHRGEQDFAAPQRHHVARKVHRIDAGRLAAAMGEDLPSAGRHRLGIDRHDDALAAEFLRGLAHEVAIGHGRGVDRHLVGAGQQQLADVLERCARRRPPSAA